MDELVSIIVPVYNVEKYIGRCIDSILRQTYQNLEIILINDGSKDNSLQICEQYAATDKRIVVLSQNNAGVSAARNAGIDAMSGEYVAFVDSDDYIHQEYIEYLLGLCTSHNCKVSQIQYSYVHDEPNEHLWEEKASLSTNSTEDKYNVQEWSFHDLFSSPKRCYRAIVCGKLFHSELFKEYRFPVGRIYEDEEAAFMLLYRAKEIVISSLHMYFYYMSRNSIMRNEKKAVNWDFLFLHQGIISFLEKEDEALLLNSERKELCIRLMMAYLKAQKINSSKADNDRLLIEFKKQYVYIQKNRRIPRKEWMVLSLFYRYPNIVSLLLNRTDLIRRAKIKRVMGS